MHLTKYWYFANLGFLLLEWLLLGWTLLRWSLVGWVILLTLRKSKIDLTPKLSPRETGCLSNFLGYVSIATGTPHWLLRPVNVSTSYEIYPGYFRLPTFVDCSGSRFLIHSLSQHSQLGYIWLSTPHCTATMWLTGRYATPLVTRWFPPNPCLGKQRISTWGEKYFKHVPPLTNLIYFSLKGL